jgi:alpha-L-rhamnosidase
MTVALSDLRCERLVDPLGIGTPTPRLSWRLRAEDEVGVLQEAWQVAVTDAAGTVAWDSGRTSGREQSVRYGGRPIVSRESMTWRARAWTNRGRTEWSLPAAFEVGLLDPSDWQASMITADAGTPVVRFGARFDVPPGAIVRARLHLTAHGVCEASLNGGTIGDDVLAPGWTSYHRRLAVRTHDVTDHVRAGDNAIAVLAAPGWFSGRLGFDGGRAVYGDHVGVLAQLEVTIADEAAIVVATSPAWSAAATGHEIADLYDGETFDARVPDGPTVPVRVVEGFDHRCLVAPAVPPIRRVETLGPASVRSADDGTLLVDVGQNVVGRLRLRMRDLAAGQRVTVRHAEVLDPDGRLFTAPLRTAKATDTYVAAGRPEEVYEPAFTFHGFRFAEITGVDRDSVDVEAVVIHSDLDRTGTFACSDPLVERLHENVVWGQRGNFVGVPTDCPQRDERLGWTGDAQVFSPTASYLFDCQTFWESWLADLAGDQRHDGAVPHVVPDLGRDGFAGAAGWGDAAVVVPWTTYEAYGDAAVLRAALPSMLRWVDYIHGRLDDDLAWRRDFQFGDWLDPDAPVDQPWRAKARYDLVATAYAARSTGLLARVGEILGDGRIADEYGERAAALRASWWSHFADAAATSQTGCALAIEFGLAPSDDDRARLGDALAQLVRDAGTHLATGFLGTPLLLPALTDTGHLDLACELLVQDTCPSWLYQVRAGATTIWERWDALRPDGSVAVESIGAGSGSSMVSFNHYAYGSVADWIHRTVVGLAPDIDRPGYRHVAVRPRPGGTITAAAGSLRTRYGDTKVSWRLGDDAQLVLDVVIPPNATATVTVPGEAPVEVGSGLHRFGS